MFDFEILSKWAAEKPSVVAFADEEHILTFSQLNSMARKTATVLSEQGISQSDLVCIALPSYLEWTTSLALHLLGVTTMSKIGTSPFVEPISPKWLISIVADTRFPIEKTIFFDEKFLDQIKLSPELSSVPGYIDEDYPARLLGTSGTIGMLKYVALSSRDLSEYVNRRGSEDFSGEEPVLSLFPLGARYGRAIRSLNEGRAFFNSNFSDYRLPKLLRKYPIKTLVGSPLQISAFLDTQLNTGSELSHLKNIVMNGSTPTSQLVERIRSQLDCRIFNGYGSTEAGGIGLKEIVDGSSQGFRINPAVDLQIVDENDEALPLGQTGHIRYRRPGMSVAYYKNPLGTAKFFREGYFYPGDLGFIDQQGQLVLDGRSSEVLNLGGMKINPEKVDEIAMAQLGIIDCATFAALTSSGVEELAIALITDQDFDLDYFIKVMSKKIPWDLRFIVPTTKIPRTDSGKILRNELQEEFIRQNRP